MEEKKMSELLKGVYDSLTDEQKEKVKGCKTLDEFLALAGKEGVELPDELLDAASGGIVYRLMDFDTQSFTGFYIYTNENDPLAEPEAGYTYYDLDEAKRQARLHGWSDEVIDF